jgi:5-methylcytosine-specific restriction enzyme subunit McrC
MKTITLSEHQDIVVGEAPGANELTVGEVMALDSAQRAAGVEAFRWAGRNRIRAASWVGVIATPAIRLEILPKIDGLGVGETRHTLIRMIAIAWDVAVHDGEITALDFQNRDLLELLIGLFARRLQRQVRGGLSRAYQRHSDDLRRLRGKLNVKRQFSSLAASPQKLSCYFDEFTADTPLNRLLLCTALHLRRRSAAQGTQRLLSEIVAHFEDVEEIHVAEALAADLRFDRGSGRWEIPARLARLLLSATYQTAHTGKQDGIALLFDMNVLFEAYVAALARRALVPMGFKVHSQKPLHWLARSGEGRGAFQTRPDLHVERDGQVVVFDTKWKRLDANKLNYDVSQADAYQMHGYAHVYQAQAVVLVYPHHNRLGARSGLQHMWLFKAGGAALAIASIDVSQPTRCSDVLKAVLEQVPRVTAA